MSTHIAIYVLLHVGFHSKIQHTRLIYRLQSSIATPFQKIYSCAGIQLCNYSKPKICMFKLQQKHQIND